MKITTILSAVVAAFSIIIGGCGLQTEGGGGATTATALAFCADAGTDSGSDGGTDSGRTIGQPVVSTPDAGVVGTDSGSTEAGSTHDGGTPDAGTTSDAGATTDTGTNRPDVVVLADAGTTPDAGTPDVGTVAVADAGVMNDCGETVRDSGTDSGTDSGSADVGTGVVSHDAGNASSLPDPFKSPAPCEFAVSEHYVSGATSGELRGNLPSATWTSGIAVVDTGNSGYMSATVASITAGTYEFSYVGYQGSSMVDAWAQYGLASDIAQMSTAGRAFLFCNWWNAAMGSLLVVAQPNCEIRVSVDETCNISPAGNMANFAAN